MWRTVKCGINGIAVYLVRLCVCLFDGTMYIYFVRYSLSHTAPRNVWIYGKYVRKTQGKHKHTYWLDMDMTVDVDCFVDSEYWDSITRRYECVCSCVFVQCSRITVTLDGSHIDSDCQPISEYYDNRIIEVEHSLDSLCYN